jgi:TetR/AcrR family transcriptional regulator, transcriptional repressor for nem operon
MTDSKEHILQVATRLFLHKGYRDVTMNELVRESGFSKGAFYHYFESKEMLFMEVFKFFFGVVMKNDFDSYSSASFYQFYHDYLNELLSKSMYYLEMMRGDSTVEEITFNYFLLSFDALKLFPELRETNIKEMEKEFRIWKNAIALAREKGEIKTKLNDDDVARMFLSMNDGVAIQMIVSGTSIEKALKDFMDIMDKFYELIKA